MKTGPGGTELLLHPKVLARKPISKFGPVPATMAERTASHLREAVERAQVHGKDAQEQARQQRRQFWMDTCREVFEMQAASRQVLELHREHGCRFHVPTAKQVQYVLDALDSALPRWDGDHPGLFFRTLELNFPELVRVCRAHRRV